MGDLGLDGKVALVTGASRGIGRFLALSLAEHGARIVGTARRLDSSDGAGPTLGSTVREIEDGGGEAMAVPCRITDPDEARSLIELAHNRFGRVDLVVNNAGVFPHRTITEMTPAEWQETMEINVNAVFNICHYVVPVMMRQGSGHIVNVSSYLADYYHPTHVAYSASKAAVDRFSVNLAAELEGTGVRVNVWKPGLTATDMTSGKGEPVEHLGPSFLWLVSEEGNSLNGFIAERREFGKSWGPKDG